MDEKNDSPSSDNNIANIEQKLDFLLRQLNKLSTSVNFSKLKKETTGLEYSKLCSTLAFVLCSLHHVQHKLDGNTTPNHQISSSLNKIKGYMKQIIHVQSKDNEKTPKIDKMAVGRMIKSAI